ncbi:VOC family protein [Paraburkholderia caledonica]|uniref:Catechol 2,3-dioxygenase-like lactoylglutathione lyase family enzyme n=1 Tax=Paraburkholderia caledonica TaxID=134536 RepID=A0AB73IN39_9BURK|nr:catechol 2,3-dioxygenase-like lactoylglutathione lyase family enzyme [Paraburkholderia caledonica]
MPLLPDHLVIRVHDLEQTIADFTETGFTVQRGGTHADGSTHNALVGFADGSYIELIAFLKDAREHRWWDEQHRAGEGFVDFALLPDSVSRTVEAAYARGLRYDGPIPGGRIRPDGTRLEWQIGRPATRDLPFLCGDLTPRFLRVAEGDVRQHRNAATGLAAVNVAVSDLGESIGRYRLLLGDVPVHRSVLADQGVHLATFTIGATTVTLLSPVSRTGAETASASTLASALRAQLDIRGEGVFGAALSVDDAAQARPLPLRLTHGARLELVPSAAA